MRIVHDRGSLADEKIIETDVAASGEVARLLRTAPMGGDVSHLQGFLIGGESVRRAGCQALRRTGQERGGITCGSV
eukprot:7380361-Prymnesium_polylepis.1